TLHPHHVNLDWMKCIPDAQSLSAVSIPGTDQSLKEGGVNPYRNFQVWKLSNQLFAGVRFFDMTVYIQFGTLYIENNGMINLEKFAHTVNELQIFLRDKKSETVLLRLTGNAKAISLAKKMLSEGTVIDLWKDKNIPKMGEARGKIVLIQSPDFNWGLPINAKVLTTKDKVAQMQANIKSASEHCQNEMMLTDTGAKGQYEKPRTVAEKLNKQLDDYLLSLLHLKKQPSCIGIIAMDFPGPKLIQQIIFLSCHSGTGSNEPDTDVSPPQHFSLSQCSVASVSYVAIVASFAPQNGSSEPTNGKLKFIYKLYSNKLKQIKLLTSFNTLYQLLHQLPNTDNKG
uniref:Uncharacterized protein n=1 Tax=Astyanax mexicanus TaxID=7994 RepID=A0A8B9JK88_ASTMX